jgi:hypothetical protein
MTSAPVTIKVSPFVTTTTLIPRGSFWRYLDDGSNQGAVWRATNFNDNAWASGRARLGYGSDGEVTPLNFGVSSNKYITYYFRRGFNVSDLSVITNLTYRLLRDDGAVVYLNSNEVYRSNMPGGAITYLTGAFSSVSGGDEQTFYETNTGPTHLRIGTNTLAVEIHQVDGMSSDVGFDLELIATGPPPPPPRLSASRSGTNVRLTWPANATGFQLESALTLDGGTNWSFFPASVGTSNTESVVTTPASGPQRFFRLRK